MRAQNHEAVPKSDPRLILALAVLGFSAAACASNRPAVASPDRTVQDRVAASEASVVHLLDRTTFGARTQDIETVRRLGVNAFLDQQMHPERIDDGAAENRLASFETLRLSSKDINENCYVPAQEARRRQQMETQALRAAGSAAAPPPSNPAAPPAGVPAANQELFRRERLPLQELSAQKALRAVYSERQFQEVLVDFWFNHFNVFAGKGADRGLLTSYERDVIRPHVFGKFRDLLGAVAQSPAMLFYLDNWLSVDPNGPHAANRSQAGGRLSPAAPPGFRVVQGGSPLLPRAAAPQNRPTRGLNENYARELLELHTLGVDGGYTQHDVIEVARCFTGWTIAQPRDGGDFRFDARQHDPGEKIVLAHVIKPGGGRDDGDKVLDIVARDPHTARFIATKLARRFVADDPPASLVERVARRFRETDGDLRETYRALLLSPEFRAAGAYDAKTKTPLEFVASALRATRAEIADATAVVQAVRTLGMPLYYCQPPTGYPDRADAWMNAGTLVNRMNFALALAGNRLPGVRVDVAALSGTSEPAAARAAISRAVIGDNPSPATMTVLDKASSVPQMVALALGAPDFQKR